MKTILKPLGLALLLAFPLAAAGTTTPGKAVSGKAAVHKAAPAKAKAPAHPINLNTATATELTQLPRIGAKAAERIVAWRKQHGGFQRPEDLMSVKGVGEKSFLKLKPYLTVGTGPVKAAPASVSTRSQAK